MIFSIKRKLINLGLIVVSSIITLLFFEVVLRCVNPHNQYLTKVPVELDRSNKFYQFFNIDSVYHYSVNEFGYRSPSLFSKDRYGIMTIGGSTTECLGLDDVETWPWLLEGHLKKSSLNQNFTVGNVGVTAFNSFHHVLQVKNLEPQFENIKMILLLVGINDFGRSLYLSEDKLIPDEKELLHQSFVRHPREMNEKWYQRTELWSYLRDAVNFLRNINEIEHQKLKLYDILEKYKVAEKKTVLPDLQLQMKLINDNILTINKYCKERDIKLVVMTQPVLWHANMTEEETRISCYGVPNIEGKVYTNEAMAKGMDAFNQNMLKMADENNIDAIDLAKYFPKTTEVFFDFCHYTKKGSSLVSDIVFKRVNEMLENEKE